jgi:hypothetical protein
MRSSPACCKLVPVLPSETKFPPMMADRMSFTLELEPGPDSIRGCLRGEDGTTHSFAGWLGLAGVLQRVLDVDPIEGEG